MSILAQKIKELEAKHKATLKADKAKLMAKYRAEQKKAQEAEEKLFFAKINKCRKLINDDILLFGGLQNVINAINGNDEASAKRLNYFRGLVQKENNTNVSQTE